MATPLLAPMIEEGYFSNNISQAVIETYLSHDDFSNIDALLLACTHYPLIRKHIEAYFKGQVEVFDSTDVVATTVKKKLQAANLLNPQKRNAHRFCVSDYTQSFEETAHIFYAEKIELEHCAIW